MPRYFFNIHDGDHFTPDHVGVELEGERSKEGSADHCEGRGLDGTSCGLRSRWPRKAAWPRFCCKRIGTGVFSSLQLTLPLLQRLVAPTQRPEPP